MAGQVASECLAFAIAGLPIGYHSLASSFKEEAIGNQPDLCSAIGIVQCSINGV